MFVLANFLNALAVVLDYVIQCLVWLVVARALLSWVNPDPANPIVQFVDRITEPILAPFQRLIPATKIGIDISPVFAVLFLYFLKLFAVSTLVGLAARIP